MVKYYLVAYNLVSALGWAYVLVGTVQHLLDPAAAPSRLFAKFSPTYAQAVALEKFVPAALVPVVRRAATTYSSVGTRTTAIQTLAIMEVLHSLLGWVRSPLVTVAMQVASRYYIVWGINHFFQNVRLFPDLRFLHTSHRGRPDAHAPRLRQHGPLLVHHRSHPLRLLRLHARRLGALPLALAALHDILAALPHRRLL